MAHFSGFRPAKWCFLSVSLKSKKKKKNAKGNNLQDIFRVENFLFSVTIFNLPTLQAIFLCFYGLFYLYSSKCQILSIKGTFLVDYILIHTFILATELPWGLFRERWNVAKYIKQWANLYFHITFFLNIRLRQLRKGNSRRRRWMNRRLISEEGLYFRLHFRKTLERVVSGLQKS